MSLVNKISLIASLVAQMVKNLLAMPGTRVQSLSQEDSPREEDGYPFQYSCLGHPTDRGAWWATVRGDAESQT